MSYVLINGSSQRLVTTTARIIKSDLLAQFDRDVIVVHDFMSETTRGQAMLAEAQSPSVRPIRALTLVLEQRKALIRDVILPAVDKGKGVIYIGGVLDDERYIRNTGFHSILKENQEMLQSLGGHCYPVGCIHVKDVGDSQHQVREYFKRAERMRNSMAGLKLINYSYTQGTLHKINDLFK